MPQLTRESGCQVNSAPAAATARADSVSEDLRSFLRESVALLPAGVQIAVLDAIQQSRTFFSDEYGWLNHAEFLIAMATKEGEA